MVTTKTSRLVANNCGKIIITDVEVRQRIIDECVKFDDILVATSKTLVLGKVHADYDGYKGEAHAPPTGERSLLDARRRAALQVAAQLARDGVCILY